MSNMDLLGLDFISNNGTVSIDEVYKMKFVGVYFSAHWCPPCRAFTPVLADFYKKVNEKEKVLEIIFISFDKDEAGFKEYFGTMPWISLPFSSENKEELSKVFGVQGIPQFSVMNQLGEVIDKDARTTVQQKGLSALENWEALLK